MTKIKIVIYIFFLLISQIVSAQFALQYNIETNIITGNGKYTPFYLMNNRQGKISFKPNNGYLQALIHRDIDTNKRFSYGFGLNIIGAYNNGSPIYLQQLYGDIKYRCLGLSIGAKETGNLIQNDQLSSGSMIWSGNSRPIPQVSIGIPNFVEIPHTNGWMQIKGEIAYGIFVDNKYQIKNKAEGMQYSKNVLFHRKYLLIKIDNKNKPFFGSIGIDMAAQFGGTEWDTYGRKIQFSSNLKSFIHIFIPMAGGDNTPDIDQVNIEGNHLGSYLMEFGYKQKDWKSKIYYEHFFEDHSGMIFKNKLDGLWGLEFSTQHQWPITGFVFEVMNSTNQSGPFLWDKTDEIPIQVSGGDYYYGHACYNGWTHQGHTIGNPFITSPGYNTDGYLGFKSSRVRAFHVGFNGYVIPELKYRVLAGHQRGWGTPFVPFTHIAHEFSTLIDFDYQPKKLKGWNFNLAGAFDKGSLFGNNWGIQIGIRKEGILFQKKQ
ncbi:capsule assembly Wzi family protein [Gabonia massiliensis]|uniref:capsule assembly Wzi family protein n=1 Tax=Gabonia massiliensis TaxID=1686296 RepID=UPI0006D7FE6C|nr:capsule assembly Wzi family protein [Gabonia massiliensis]